MSDTTQVEPQDDIPQSAIARAKAELLKELGLAKDDFLKAAHEATGIVPQVVKQDVENQPSTQELIQIINNLRAEVDNLKKNPGAAVADIADAFAQGGEPVPHNLHLDDGAVIANFPGLATHYADENGTRKVVAAYPVSPDYTAPTDTNAKV